MGNITNLYNRVEDLERKICCTTRFFDNIDEFPTPGKAGVLYVDKETGNIYIWGGEGYILSGSEDPLFLFQVGIPLALHIHWAALTGNQAKQLIQNTNGALPVADPLQPFVVITTGSNGNPGDEHVHDLTIYFDYVNHTFIVTDITNNLLDNHEAHLIGAGGGVPDLTATQIAYGDGDGLMTSSSDFVVDDSGGAGLAKVGINTATPLVALDVVGTVNVSQVLTLAPTGYASLPTGVRGMLANINDSDTNTWGGVISGGGANTVLAFYNGSDWTVMGI